MPNIQVMDYRMKGTQDTVPLCRICTFSKSGLLLEDPEFAGPYGIVLQHISAVANIMLQEIKAALKSDG